MGATEYNHAGVGFSLRHGVSPIAYCMMVLHGLLWGSRRSNNNLHEMRQRS
ncbi:hypothetical protein DFR28_102192 [Arenicella xantha]|uniref:Uncharacterized protein n=1 Tax=Arenicella xantha TaxID=644221 RepID=A0A395JJ16_9GAMM|nr:hypothetical protein DFR28_102192 [Arenicella xantha]